MTAVTTEVLLKVISTGGTLVAMVLIGWLVHSALQAGIDGVMFFVGVAAIAGLGGYELRWAKDLFKGKGS